MARQAQTIYDNMEFPPYEYKEYPKTVGNERDDPTKHGKGVVVNSKEEEAAYFASKNPAAEEED